MSQPDPYLTVLHSITAHADHVYVGVVLIAAGFLPSFFTSATLSAIYFALLIPPAAWHCYIWGKKTVFPKIQEAINRIRGHL